MNEIANSRTFCPIINDKCVKNECVMWIDDDCIFFDLCFQKVYGDFKLEIM